MPLVADSCGRKEPCTLYKMWVKILPGKAAIFGVCVAH